ncbi:probable G-protein coupled receptor 139 [Scyliorhinus canicula]|uniref:probable G-protein coupled receptor 139 n=1 Tax=Scyliorhinus canicula TaxID=7830 RepID=UPI0018F5DEA0|nr:probable G-protein coupled receptor 139 [Scyliorhinus canicula]
MDQIGAKSHGSSPAPTKPTVPLSIQIKLVLEKIEEIYYPILVGIGVSFNLVTIVILSRGKCGLSKCVTHYLVAMATADLLVVIVDLILRRMPVVYWFEFNFVNSISLCNIHAVLLYAVTDCSVWFTVLFTFDRFVAICCQKLKAKYCNGKTAAIVIAVVTVLSFLKNIFWFFLYTSQYRLADDLWFCVVTGSVRFSLFWRIIELLHYVSTPCIPFFVIILFNVLTVRHIIAANIVRQRLRGQRSGEKKNDPEVQNRKKSIIVMFTISGNFIVLWAVCLIYSVGYQMRWLGYSSIRLHYIIGKIGFIFQLLNCCTNTWIYAMTQTKFRVELMKLMKYPLVAFVKLLVKIVL